MKQCDVEITKTGEGTRIQSCTTAGNAFYRNYEDFATTPADVMREVVMRLLQTNLSFAVYQL